MKRNRIPAWVGAVLCAPLVTLAQTPPDAGALQQQIDRERQQQLPQRIAPELPAAPATLKPKGEVSITVKQFRFVGNTLMTAEQLAPAVADFLDRPLDFAQLQAAAAAIADHYRAAGWVVKTYLPQQEIKEGVVTIQIIEAVFGKLRLEGPPAMRVGREQLEGLVAAQQNAGASLHAGSLDRALLLADDLPGVSVRGNLLAGSQLGETDLVLQTSDESPATGEVVIDNAGARSTGAERLDARLDLNSPLRLGDRLSGNLIHTKGSDYLRLGYTLPVGNHGWRAGGSASILDYELVASDFVELDADGDSVIVGLEASYPLIRARLKNLFFTLNQDHKAFNNEAGDAPTSRYTMDTTSAGLYGNHFDNLGGGGANSASLVWVFGGRDNEVGTTDDRFSKVRYSLARQQVITADLAFLAQILGQESNHQLDSSEQFYLGGDSGVRAYPGSEGNGDSGLIGTLELRWSLPERVSVTGLYDYGEVRNNSEAMSYSLKGYGLALGWLAPFGAQFKATWAHRIGDNPNPTPSGKDQDGSLDKNRLWLAASLTL